MAPTASTNTGGNTRTRRAARTGPRVAVALALGLMTAGCSTVNSAWDSVFGGGPKAGQPGYVSGFLGGVVADEPNAALLGRQVLSAGGTAADAAVAIGLSLAVTLPSRAGLGGGGVCLAYSSDRRGITNGIPETILFLPPPARGLGGGDRRAAVPMLARGLFLLHARHGRQPFETMLSGAEQMARAGVPVSRALARDLALVAGPLFADPGARAVFGPAGGPLAQGQGLAQPELAGTLAQLRSSGVGDLYTGNLARRVEQMSPSAGVPIGTADLRAALPSFVAPVIVAFNEDKVAFPPTEGGLAAASAFITLRGPGADLNTAMARSLAAAARARQPGATTGEILNGPLPMPGATPLYPASTSFATLDPDGNAVVCALTMNNLFGTGRMVPGMGFLAAASPASPPLLAAGLAWSESRHAFHAAVGGSGQAGAPLAVAAALSTVLRTGQPMPSLVPEPGRANVIFCARYLPGSESSCTGAADPREGGLSAAAN